MFMMVFVEHNLWGGNCIQRQKNTGMIGVSFSKSVYKVRINVWDGSCKTHFWTPRKLDYGNNIHPCFQICALMADISGRNLQLWWSWPWCSSVFRAVEVIREKIGQLGSDLHASFLQKFPGGESVKVFNFVCLLAFSELCMYCPPNLPESLCSGWSNFKSAWWVRVADWLGGVGNKE